MTYEDFQHWGNPGYTVSIEDSRGFPVGISYVDGTYIPVGSSHVGDIHDHDGTYSTVVWDGAYITPNGGHTKGRLLALEGPMYIDSLVAYGYRREKL